MLNKIKNNIFLKSTLVLLIGGVLGKLVGFILKIIVTRKLGAEGMGLYSLLTPTSSLLSVIATLSYPTALSKIISEKSSRTKTLFISIIPLSIIINFFIILITILIAPTLSTLLKNEILYYPIICLSLVTPFISISSIIKGYFWGNADVPIKKDDHSLDELRYYVMTKPENHFVKPVSFIQKDKERLFRKAKNERYGKRI